jgi:hypothetical protein
MVAISHTESGKESATLLRLSRDFAATLTEREADNSEVRSVITGASVVGFRSDMMRMVTN